MWRRNSSNDRGGDSNRKGGEEMIASPGTRPCFEGVEPTDMELRFMDVVRDHIRPRDHYNCYEETTLFWHDVTGTFFIATDVAFDPFQPDDPVVLGQIVIPEEKDIDLSPKPNQFRIMKKVKDNRSGQEFNVVVQTALRASLFLEGDFVRVHFQDRVIGEWVTDQGGQVFQTYEKNK